MKQNIGTILFIISGMISFFLFFYFLQKQFIFSIFSLIATIMLLFYAIQNNKYGNDQIISIENTPQKITLKYSKLIAINHILIHSIFVVLGIFGLQLTNFDVKSFNNSGYFIIIPAIGFIIFGILKSISEIIKTYKISVSLDDFGIQIDNNERINWNEIHNERVIVKYFKSHASSRHNYKAEINYLQFYHHNKKIEVKIDDLNVTHSNLDHYLKIFRKRFEMFSSSNQTFYNK